MTENTRKNTKTLLLYSTSGCHLCEQAKSLIDFILMQQPDLFELSVVDIVHDDSLFSKYGVSIPVIRFDKNEAELSWPFDIKDLEGFIQSPC